MRPRSLVGGGDQQVVECHDQPAGIPGAGQQANVATCERIVLRFGNDLAIDGEYQMVVHTRSGDRPAAAVLRNQG